MGNKIVDHSDVVGALPVSATETTSSFSTYTWLQWIGQRQLQEEMRNIEGLGFGEFFSWSLTVLHFNSAVWEMNPFWATTTDFMNI